MFSRSVLLVLFPLLCVVRVFESLNSSAVLNVKWQHPKGHALPSGLLEKIRGNCMHILDQTLYTKATF